MARKKVDDAEATPKTVPSYAKEQIMRAERFRGRRDLLAALLDETETYTMEQVDGIIDKFMKGKVN